VKLVLFEEARAEAAEAAVWYESKQARAGERFLAALDNSLAQLENAPLRFPELESIQPNDIGLRRVLLPAFPYLIIYQIVGDEIRVIAVAHARRQPDYWKDRLT
jgi:plasmid stabilization system protein ParE